jgi:RNA polymerase sigma-70 factor (ECF subfamily)
VHTREGTELDPEHPAPASHDDALDVLIADERDRQLWQAVAALSSGERTAVILYYRQNMTVDEIATAVGVSTGTVKTLLFRGRQKLRKELL